MLFNSYFFIFGYCPVVVLIFFAVGRQYPDLASAWLAIASVLFYSWWNWHFTFILLISIAFNYGISRLMIRQRSANDVISVKRFLAFGVAANLTALAYYKYMSFFVTSAAVVLNSHLNWQTVVLPIGISFFTFTQIAFLVDTAQGLASEVNIFHYMLFVSYFPHLIAGPILHHSEMMPQFREEKTYAPRADSLAVGLTVFAIGLFKKVILADSIGAFADHAFSPLHSASLSMVEAWAGALAYTFQIYFDFSGYTDMAIGISRLFNIRLPANFESPYQSLSIIDFWRRWHMTLSRFLRDYLYIPLGGNRKGSFRRYVNLLATMTLGGLWHGAGWTFVVWGVLHGIYLMVNHAWNHMLERFGPRQSGGALGKLTAWSVTFLSVVVAWVFFRAPDFETASNLLKGMVGCNGVLPVNDLAVSEPLGLVWLIVNRQEIAWILLLFGIAVFMPNLRQIMEGHELVLNTEALRPVAIESWVPLPQLRWRPSLAWVIISFTLFLVSLTQMTKISQFLYFQF